MKSKKVIELMKDETGGKTMKDFAALKAKTYSYLTNNSDEDKKGKSTKNVLSKENLNLKILLCWSELIQRFIVFTSINYFFKVPLQDQDNCFTSLYMNPSINHCFKVFA